MKIDLLKTNLRHIVLLAKEYREKIPDSVDDEILKIENALGNDNEVSQYDRQYLYNAKQEKNTADSEIHKQIIYFAEKILMTFTKPFARCYRIEIDDRKLDEAIKHLSKDEIRLLLSVFELYSRIEEVDCERTAKSQIKPIAKFLKPEIEKIIDVSTA